MDELKNNTILIGNAIQLFGIFNPRGLYLRLKTGTIMKIFISLLRGINVSGQNMIKMPELKRLYDSLCMVNVETYIQSGNVVFESAEKDPAVLTWSIEAEIGRAFGLDVKVILRNRDRFKQIINNNPYLNQSHEDPEKLYVTFLSDKPSEFSIKERQAPYLLETDEGDEFMAYDQEIYLFCPHGYGKTKFSNAFFEKKLHVSATTRNWKTVRALFEMANQR
jgi:uncharacterized protein (DUF1697 family)